MPSGPSNVNEKKIIFEPYCEISQNATSSLYGHSWPVRPLKVRGQRSISRHFHTSRKKDIVSLKNYASFFIYEILQSSRVLL